MADDNHLRKLKLHLEQKRLEWATAKVKLELEELNYKGSGKIEPTIKTKVIIPEKRKVKKATIIKTYNIEKIISISIGIAFVLSIGIYLFASI